MADGSACTPHLFREAGFQTACEYAIANAADCEGGGYIPWLALELCAGSSSGTLAVVALAFFMLLYLFLLLSIAANDFFCPNIATIVDYHKISQNIAGITLMAFGNGAPDIFSSIASVISVKNPQAGLAISELLGGGIFVTTIVVAALTFIKPFDVMRRPSIRDISFYLVALAFLVFVVAYDSEIYIWQPIVFLLLYIIYALTVISSSLYYKRAKRRRKKSAYGVLVSGDWQFLAKVSDFLPSKKAKVAAADEAIEEKAPRREMVSSPVELQAQDLPSTRVGTALASVSIHSMQMIPSAGSTSSLPSSSSEDITAKECLEAGKFFGKELLDEQQEDENDPSTSVLPIDVSNEVKKVESKRRVSLVGHHNTTLTPRHDGPTLNQSLSSSSVQSRGVAVELHRFLRLLNPIDNESFKKATALGKIFRIMSCPWIVVLKLSTPLSTSEWSKLLTMVHAFTAPLAFCAAFQVISIPDSLSFQLRPWHVVFPVSILSFMAILAFTSADSEPVRYRQFSAYVGAILAIAVIYAAATEVVNLILMFGHYFNVSYSLMGLTFVAWANSIGDLMADTAVAKQGYPRMGFAAAFGAPLFNLLVGLGSTLLIAKMQGKTVTVHADSVKIIMCIALVISLSSTLISLFLHRFRAHRSHGVFLCIIYLLFLIGAIMASQGSFVAALFG